MMRLLSFIAGLAMLAGNALGQGADIIIREKAKQLRDQNNARQGVPPPAAPANASKPATPAPASAQPPTATTPAGMARLPADLASIKTNSTVTPEQQQRLTSDLAALAQGPVRPSGQATSRLAANVAAGLTQKSLTPAERSRLIQNLNALMNSSTLPKDRMPDILADVEKIFKGTERAAAISSDAKAIAAEVQKTAAK